MTGRSTPHEIFNTFSTISSFRVKVKPNSHRSEITGVKKEVKGKEKEDVLLVTVKSPPEDGKANKELLKLLHKQFGGQFVITQGLTSREKVVKRV